MSSPRQRAANRLNALKSAGSKTRAGKRRSAINATRHALTVPIDTSSWAPLLAPITELLIKDGLTASEARDTARRILDYERNVQYQRERFLMDRSGQGPVFDHSEAGAEELLIAQLMSNALRSRSLDPSKRYMGLGKEAAMGVRNLFRQIGARKIREANRDAERAYRNADRHLRRAANQLIRQTSLPPSQ